MLVVMNKHDKEFRYIHLKLGVYLYLSGHTVGRPIYQTDFLFQCISLEIRCNESPLRSEKPDFWPVSKFNTGSLPLRGNPAGNKHILTPHFRTYTAGA